MEMTPETKTGYITALEKPSGSEEGEGISGGGSGGGRAEEEAEVGEAQALRNQAGI